MDLNKVHVIDFDTFEIFYDPKETDDLIADQILFDWVRNQFNLELSNLEDEVKIFKDKLNMVSHHI